MLLHYSLHFSGVHGIKIAHLNSGVLPKISAIPGPRTIACHVGSYSHQADAETGSEGRTKAGDKVHSCPRRLEWPGEPDSNFSESTDGALQPGGSARRQPRRITRHFHTGCTHLGIAGYDHFQSQVASSKADQTGESLTS